MKRHPAVFVCALLAGLVANLTAAQPKPETMSVPGLGITMVKITRGTFQMGHEAGYPGSSNDERPVTTVTFSKDFWLGATDVTVAQFRQFVAATKHVTEVERLGGVIVVGGEKEPGRSWKNPGYQPEENFPVVLVSWSDAMKFCEWLNEREKAAGRLPAGHVYTLPTEAQWEYAARAGSTDDPGHWRDLIAAEDEERKKGKTISGKSARELAKAAGYRESDPDADEFSWHAGNSGGKIHPVGQKKPNPWGLYDMLGLVWQWVLDWRGPYPGGHVVDPTGPEFGTTRENRSGMYGSPRGHGIMSTNRWSTPGHIARTSCGFRVALSAVK